MKRILLIKKAFTFKYEQDVYPLSTYVFRVMLLLTTVCSAVSIITNIFTNFPPHANIKWVVLMLFSVTALCLIQQNKAVELLKLLMFSGLLFGIILPAWFYGGGDNSITLLYILLVIVEAFIIFESSILKWLIMVICVVFTIALMTIHAYYPHLIETVESINLLGDSVIQCIMVFTLSAVSLSIFTSKFNEQRRRLMNSNAQLEMIAMVDVLTGVYSRRWIFEQLERQHERVQCSGDAFYVLMIDIDFFKAINDRFGHLIGDDTLRHICKHMQSVITRNDYIGRYGGDEFVLILNSITPETVHPFIERLCKVPSMAGNMKLQMSGGMVRCHPEEDTTLLLHRADAALLEAKKRGKNQIVLDVCSA